MIPSRNILRTRNPGSRFCFFLFVLEEVSNLGLDNGIEYFILLCTLEARGLFAGIWLYLRDLEMMMNTMERIQIQIYPEQNPILRRDIEQTTLYRICSGIQI